jgi:hypothetical protein
MPVIAQRAPTNVIRTLAQVADTHLCLSRAFEPPSITAIDALPALRENRDIE